MLDLTPALPLVFSPGFCVLFHLTFIAFRSQLGRKSKPDSTAENSDIAMYESSSTDLGWSLDDDMALGASLIRGIGNVESSSLLVCAGKITPGEDYLPLTV